MVFSIFGNNKKDAQPNGTASSEQPGRFVREMQANDIKAVVAIIEEHDEDDAEEAAEGFRESIKDMFVAVDNGRVVGVTGASRDEEAEGIVWLSWTYVASDQRRQGIGRYMVGGLFDVLQNAGMRKVYMSTGDFREDGQDIYAEAKAFYKGLGAVLEAKIDNYFGNDESMYIYGLELKEINSQSSTEKSGALIFDGLYEAEEVEDGLRLTWKEFVEEEDGDIDPKAMLEEMLKEAQEEEMRFVIASFPHDLSEGATHVLGQQGFKSTGVLKHYYQDGIDQLIYIKHINQFTS